MEMHDWNSRPVKRGPSAGAVIFLALIFGIVGGLGGMLLALWANQQYNLNLLPGAAVASTTPAEQPVQTVGAIKPGMSFAQIADELDGSVVNINTRTQQADPFSFFYGGGGSQVVQGIGTGVIVDPNGYILTNYHVVGTADKIDVTVQSGKGKAPKVYSAKIIGGDKQEDLAVIKIEATGLKAVTFGNSDALRPGDPVMAIGNPFGFEHTVSVGVVSALNRDLPVDQSVMLKHMIQTDASINPGNSGGPLVNAQGQVIGINSAIYVGSGSNEPQANGIGFAIPSNHAVQVMSMLRNKKPFPYIGISYAPITDDLRQQQRLPVKSGVYVQQVLPNSPAAQAGLLQSDLITSMNGKKLLDQNALSDEILKLGVGRDIALNVLRWDMNTSAWQQRTINVKIGRKPANLDQRMQQLEQQDQQDQQDQQPQDNGSPNPHGGFPFPIPGF